MRGDDTRCARCCRRPGPEAVCRAACAPEGVGRAPRAWPLARSRHERGPILPDASTGRLLTRAILLQSRGAGRSADWNSPSVRHEARLRIRMTMSHVCDGVVGAARHEAPQRRRRRWFVGLSGTGCAGLCGRPDTAARRGRDLKLTADAQQEGTHRRARVAGGPKSAPAAGKFRRTSRSDGGVPRWRRNCRDPAAPRSPRDVGCTQGRCLPPARAPLRQSCAAAARARRPKVMEG